MIRLGKSYQHFSRAGGCACANPMLQKISTRLDRLSRRHFLAGAAATAAAILTKDQALAQPERILLTHVRLFDGKSDSLRPGIQILIEGNRIASVDAANNPPPEGARVIDCGDRVLMPGLIDAHWHAVYAAVPLPVLMEGDPGMIFAASTAEAERTLLRGFTTIRDLGGPTFSFKRAIDNGLIPGPRIFPSGAMITTTGGHGDLRLPTEIPRDGGRLSTSELMGAAAIVDDTGDLKLRVREQLLQGASQIKIVAGGGVSSPRSPLDMSTFSEDEIRAAVEVAKDWNTYVTVHAYASNTVERSLRAGVSCVEHGHLIDERTARMIAEKDVWLSTQPFLTTADAAPQTGPSAARIEQLFAGTPTLYQLARKYAIKTAWGSDVLFSPEMTPRQNFMLTHLSQWYSNAQVLQAATSVNADLLALSNLRNPYPGRLGVIEQGAFADLLLLGENPLDDIHVLERPAQTLLLVIKDGQIFKNTLPS
jgi:imidazolonepropionase-like amidohydrolase